MENPQTTTSSMTTAAATTADEEAASAIWNWETLFDFSVAAEDDPLLTFPWSTVDSVGVPPLSPSPPSAADAAFVPGPSADPVLGAPDRVRKRDPRLTCSNFLAGRIPCACPEEDAKEAEEEEAAAAAEGRVVKKRVRKGTAGSNVRCQVPGCEADISELKGYHRRHRVCLTCANAASVILDGIHMRYCQQCGKFHILPDFDEGKRSCRRKLERHNKRRRRRSTHINNTLEKEKGVQLPAEDVICAGETDIDSPCPGNKVIDAELILESDDGDVSPICSIPSICNVQSNSAASFAASGGIPKEEGVDISKLTIVSSSGDDKIGYSSMCPTGRLSFKLYDWNPAEFPRRLRHQIFQWLASMPVELEGYIRPGCTILTVFIAMPCFMWDKLSRHAAEYLNDFIHGPQSVLSGRGTVLIYLNNMIYEVLEDGTSLMNIKMEVQVPRLHYVHPTFFEAGKPMEFIVCGSNLLQPKLQFLVSFAGKYLPCDPLAIPHGKKSHAYHGSEEDSFGSLEHEIFRIHVPHTDAKLFGPAFIEVENESGLSNFIPVLVGDKPLCSDLQILQPVFNGSLELENFLSKLIDVNIVPDLCNVRIMRHGEMSELLLDIAWLLQEPLNDNREAHWTSVHVQRMICVLKFLIKHRSMSILEKILNSRKLIMDKKFGYPMDRVVQPNLNLLQECIACARGMVYQKLELDNNSELDLKKSGEIDMLSNAPTTVKGGEVMTEKGLSSATTTSSMVVKRQECYPSILQGFQWSEKGCGQARPSIFTKTRLAILLMVSVAMCFGICITLFHPHKAGEFAVSVRKCVLGSFEP